MRQILAPFLILAWIASGVAGEGFQNAYLRAKFHDIYQDPYWSNHTGAIILGGALGPMNLLVSWLYSDYGAAGWTLTSEPFPCTARYPEIWCGKGKK